MINSEIAKEFYIYENKFEQMFLGKQEAILALGNGYLGLRSATEEVYVGETRNSFVAGTFNKAEKNEVTELPNMADVTETEIILNGELFQLTTGKIEKYSRKLCLKNGELQRFVRWISPKGKKYELNFKRIVSLDDLHIIAQKIQIIPLTEDVEIEITTGINGRMNNHGTQHFSDGEKRFYEQSYMQMLQETIESKIVFVHNTVVKIDHCIRKDNAQLIMERRKIACQYKEKVKKEQVVTIEKISNVYTTRDKENRESKETKKNIVKIIRKNSLKKLIKASNRGYDELMVASANAWENKVWNRVPIQIESSNEDDNRAIYFAQYHLQIMTPAHDNHMNIGAKGLTGEGYKGHTFWDTDIYVLPYFIFTMPEVARKLLEYRYFSLEGARNKAIEKGYSGAWYPWESAWIDDGEVTPLFGEVNVETGTATRIWSGMKELHISADVAYGVWQYYMVSGDDDFMEMYGYEIIFETAEFWVSRLEALSSDYKYHITDVIGPDEYKEHIDDNAFTNYMAYWNIGKAIEYFQLLKKEKNALFNKLNKKINLEMKYKRWNDGFENIFLPQPRKIDQVIPQDSTYLTLEKIDLSKYKKQSRIGSILLDYSIDQIGKMQVSKQADILMLFFLLEDLFSKEVKRANWEYYEAKTLHDSSLSLSIHCILACDMKKDELAYDLFEKACRIDLGTNKNSSNEGIHAASLGGIWQCIVYGFGGVRMIKGELRIEPRLPKKWTKIEFELNWKNQKLFIRVESKRFIVQNRTGLRDVSFISNEVLYQTRKNEKCEIIK